MKVSRRWRWIFIGLAVSAFFVVLAGVVLLFVPPERLGVIAPGPWPDTRR